jgi:uncharacterized protein YutE (UPF0331/DUF86 family)
MAFPFMDDITRKVLAEKASSERVLVFLKEAIERDPRTIIEVSAMATFIHNVYNGMENILKLMLKHRGVTLSRSASWHKELLNTAGSTGIINEVLKDELYQYLTFRHFFVHTYGFMLDNAQLHELALNLPRIWTDFIGCDDKALLEP